MMYAKFRSRLRSGSPRRSGSRHDMHTVLSPERIRDTRSVSTSDSTHNILRSIRSPGKQKTVCVYSSTMRESRSKSQCMEKENVDSDVEPKSTRLNGSMHNGYAEEQDNGLDDSTSRRSSREKKATPKFVCFKQSLKPRLSKSPRHVDLIRPKQEEVDLACSEVDVVDLTHNKQTEEVDLTENSEPEPVAEAASERRSSRNHRMPQHMEGFDLSMGRRKSRMSNGESSSSPAARGQGDESRGENGSTMENFPHEGYLDVTAPDETDINDITSTPASVTTTAIKKRGRGRPKKQPEYFDTHSNLESKIPKGVGDQAKALSIKAELQDNSHFLNDTACPPMSSPAARTGESTFTRHKRLTICTVDVQRLPKHIVKEHSPSYTQENTQLKRKAEDDEECQRPAKRIKIENDTPRRRSNASSRTMAPRRLESAQLSSTVDMSSLQDKLSAGQLVGSPRWLASHGHQSMDPQMTLTAKFKQDEQLYQAYDDKFSEQLAQFLHAHGKQAPGNHKWHGICVNSLRIYMSIYDQGGEEQVCAKKRWLGTYKEYFPNAKRVESGNSYKSWYFKYLHAYSLFLSGQPYEEALSHAKELSQTQMDRLSRRPQKADSNSDGGTDVDIQEVMQSDETESVVSGDSNGGVNVPNDEMMVYNLQQGIHARLVSLGFVVCVRGSKMDLSRMWEEHVDDPWQCEVVRRAMGLKAEDTKMFLEGLEAAQKDKENVFYPEYTELERTKLTANMLKIAQRKAAQLKAAKLNAAKLNAAKLNAAKLNAAKLNAAKLNAIKLNVAKLNAAKLNAAKLKAPKLAVVEPDVPPYDDDNDEDSEEILDMGWHNAHPKEISEEEAMASHQSYQQEEARSYEQL